DSPQKNLGVAEHHRVINARDGGHTGYYPRRQNHVSEIFLLQQSDINRAAQPYGHAVGGQLYAKVAQEFIKLALAGDPSRKIELATDERFTFEQSHMVAAPRCLDGRA